VQGLARMLMLLQLAGQVWTTLHYNTKQCCSISIKCSNF
jgi:hypothetical protein